MDNCYFVNIGSAIMHSSDMSRLKMNINLFLLFFSNHIVTVPGGASIRDDEVKR